MSLIVFPGPAAEVGEELPGRVLGLALKASETKFSTNSCTFSAHVQQLLINISTNSHQILTKFSSIVHLIPAKFSTIVANVSPTKVSPNYQQSLATYHQILTKVSLSAHCQYITLQELKIVLENFPSLMKETQVSSDSRLHGWGILHNCLVMKAPLMIMDDIADRTDKHNRHKRLSLHVVCTQSCPDTWEHGLPEHELHIARGCSLCARSIIYALVRVNLRPVFNCRSRDLLPTVFEIRVETSHRYTGSRGYRCM